jgi:Zn-finger nucleic acid-binding protein
MHCPICNVDLLLAERQGIEIDYCPKCRGIWLDRGELEKIVERSGAEIQSFPDRENRNLQSEHGYKSDRHHGKPRKSWLSRVFDFD